MELEFIVQTWAANRSAGVSYYTNFSLSMRILSLCTVSLVFPGFFHGIYITDTHTNKPDLLFFCHRLNHVQRYVHMCFSLRTRIQKKTIQFLRMPKHWRNRKFIGNYKIGGGWWHVYVSSIQCKMIFCHVYFMASNIKSVRFFRVQLLFHLKPPIARDCFLTPSCRLWHCRLYGVQMIVM